MTSMAGDSAKNAAARDARPRLRRAIGVIFRQPGPGLTRVNKHQACLSTLDFK
jgi:hypothetical protein